MNEVPIYKNPTPEQIEEAASYGEDEEWGGNIRFIISGNDIYVFPATIIHDDAYERLEKIDPEIIERSRGGGVGTSKAGKISNVVEGIDLYDPESYNEEKLNFFQDRNKKELAVVDQYFDVPYSETINNQLEKNRIWSPEQRAVKNTPANPLDDMNKQMLEKPNIHGDAKGKDTWQKSIGQVTNNDYSEAMRKLLNDKT